MWVKKKQTIEDRWRQADREHEEELLENLFALIDYPPSREEIHNDPRSVEIWVGDLIEAAEFLKLQRQLNAVGRKEMC